MFEEDNLIACGLFSFAYNYQLKELMATYKITLKLKETWNW